ncbi:MAG TPA: hypothetical protein VHX38_34370 [Pseudonocardiaceae bacterium]|jgi:hypothetical protein|nr:hypothetical protein [Pseudonocardiaceae bacterium]
MSVRLRGPAALSGLGALALIAATTTSLAPVASAAPSHPVLSYEVSTPQLDLVSGGPWTLAQGDRSVGAPYDHSLPTFAAGGAPNLTLSGVSYPNLAIDPGATDAPPYQSGVTGSPGPLPGYCGAGGPNPESGAVQRQPAGLLEPMQPYYFPFVTASQHGSVLTGYFDYRPKDSDEALVAARSTDHGRTWQFAGEALELNQGVCPNGNTDDDGQGHAFVMSVPRYRSGSNGSGGSGNADLLYTLSRPAGDALGVELLVHRLNPNARNPLAGLPSSEPVGLGGATTATDGVAVPAGPGGAGVTVTVGDSSTVEMPGQFFVDGSTVDCSDTDGTATTFTGCVTTNPKGVTINPGDTVAAAPIVPSTAQATSGLIAPDGIISTVPHYPGAPRGSVAVLYTEKIVNYFIPTSTTAAVTLPAGTIPVAATSALPLTNGSVTISLGTAAGIDAVTCTGETATTLTGCTGGSGTVAKGSDVGAPGAATAPYSVLGPIGEGKDKPKSLYGNNEDLTVVRAAYTYDGLHFADLGAVSGLNDPTGNSDSTLRFIGSRGTVVTNPDGSLGLFLSGAYASDGDSDAFDQIFYSSSRDGQHWSAPVALPHTDYTFASLAAQTTSSAPLGISGYYSGRVYDPTVVPTGNGNLTMVFAGYSTPKPLPTVGTSMGTDPAKQFTVAPNEPAEYRSILTVTLHPVWH